jgi:hypothetical protein
MSERKRSRSRPRPGSEEDAGLLAAAQLHALRQLPHAELTGRAGGGWVDEEVAGLAGLTYRRRTRVLRGHDDRLHIRILVDDGTRRGSLRPLAEEIVHVMPDGHFLREQPLAPEARRRFEYPTPWFPIAVGTFCLLLIVVFLLNT